MMSDQIEQDDGAAEARFNEAHQGIMGMLFAAYKMRARKLRASQGSLPLTIIGGFLGSGKTTLLNHLLVSPHGLRLVVLVNDFGSVNIDAALIASQTDDMIGLTNGCACCAVSADLTNSLIEIAEREDPPDAIVLEASGIANPGGIAQIALTNPAIRLGGILVLADAETLQERAGDPLTSRLFHNQLAAADLIVLSKLDLLDERERAAASGWLTGQFPAKPVIKAVKGDVPADVVLDIASTRGIQAAPQPPAEHAHDFESLSVVIDAPLDGKRLQELFDSLPKSLLRAKGVLHLAEEPERRIIYQRVGARWNYHQGEPWGDGTPRSGFVFIGPRGLLDGRALEASLNSCVAENRIAKTSKEKHVGNFSEHFLRGL
jgi:G3E family GTPase